MMGNKKTAICPYAVTQDVFLESDNIPTSGQRIYNMTTGQWYTGDGVTELRNLTPSITNENGEVDLSNYYTKTEIDNKIDEIDTSEVDLSNYYTKTEVDDKISAVDGAGAVETDAIILRSSTAGSTKKFVITIDDNGTLKATELVEEVNE